MGSKSLVVIACFLILSFSNVRNSDAAALPSPEVNDVQAVALASDGSRLIIFYCSFASSLNHKQGYWWEWNGSSWNPVFGSVQAINAGLILNDDCNNPDLAVSGATVASTYNDNTGNLGTRVLTNGSMQVFSGCSGCNLTDENSPRVGFALGNPFAVYHKFNGVLIQNRLYIDNLTTVSQTSNELLGGPLVESGNTHSAFNASIIGFNNDYWVAYTSIISGRTCWAMRNSSSNNNASSHIGGNCFWFNDGGPGTVISPEVFAWQGTSPGVVWRQQDSGTNQARIHMAVFNSGTWRGVNQNLPKVDNGVITRLRAEASGSNLYIAYKRGLGNEIIVEKHDISDGGGSFNSNVTRMTVSLAPSQLASSFDLAVFQGQPYLAYLDNGKLKVQSLTSAGQSVPKNDVNGDGRADVVWRNTTNGATLVWQMTPSGTRGLGTFPGGAPLHWEIRGVADVNGDGRADMIWRNTTNGATMVWKMTASGTRGSVEFPGGLPLNWVIQAVADVNGDGRADVVWRNTTNGATHIWQMTANATRGPVTFPGGLPLNWEIQNVADVNGDGRADVVWRNTNNGATHVWQMTAGGLRGSMTFPGGLPLHWEVQ